MYDISWITEHLAAGYAPMSYEELDSIRSQGISAIVNLCGEFCDLHEIEETSGFEVYYLPVVDECAPDLEAMEKALDWMDEAIYLNKKVLVHCRHGHGRTGTFIAAYLLRRGFDFKLAEKAMKGRNANPATYGQRRFLKKYGKQVGVLQTAAPKIDNRPATDLSLMIEPFVELLARVDRQLAASDEKNCCGKMDHVCCLQPFELQLIESVYLSQVINRRLKREKREAVIERAFDLARRMKEFHHEHPGLRTEELAQAFPGERLVCPLLETGECLIFADRPLRCRLFGHPEAMSLAGEISPEVTVLSAAAYRHLTGIAPPERLLNFSSADTISGKFVQLYFQNMARDQNGKGGHG